MNVAQNISEQNEPGTEQRTVELSKDEFKAFKSFLNMIKLTFNDFVLVDGTFRSYPNDRTYIVETGFTFFKGHDLTLTNLRDKYSGINHYGKISNVKFTINSDGWEIDDSVSQNSFLSPPQDFLDNKFISYEDMERSVLSGIDPNKLIFSCVLDKLRVKKVRELSRKLASDIVYITNKENTSGETVIEIPGISDSPVPPSTFLKKPFSNFIDQNKLLKLPAFPFNFIKDHLFIKCYFNHDQSVTTLFSTKINDLFVNIYSQSEIMEPETIKKVTQEWSTSSRSTKDVIFHELKTNALIPQNKIDSHNFPFTLNALIGCHFGCQYCYLQEYPFCTQTRFPEEVKVKLWIAEKLDQELNKYKNLPQHLKRVQVNVATEGYLPLVMVRVKREYQRDIMAEVLNVFRKHWENGNYWMVHLITKSHMVLKHLDIISAMKDQIQLEITITTLDEARRRKIEGHAPSVAKRLKVMREFASAGVFVRAMCMPLIGNRNDAETIRTACFDNGARAFKHKGVNYWDEQAILNGETIKVSGRKDEVFEDLLVMSSEPYRENNKIQTMDVMMPVIVKSGKSKRWLGYEPQDLKNRIMTMENSGYSEINNINWGYVK